MAHYATPCLIMSCNAPSCPIMSHHVPSCFTLPLHGPLSPTIFHHIPQYSTMLPIALPYQFIPSPQYSTWFHCLKMSHYVPYIMSQHMPHYVLQGPTMSRIVPPYPAMSTISHAMPSSCSTMVSHTQHSGFPGAV